MIYHDCCLPVTEAGLVAEVVPLAAYAALVAEIAVVEAVPAPACEAVPAPACEAVPVAAYGVPLHEVPDPVAEVTFIAPNPDVAPLDPTRASDAVPALPIRASCTLSPIWARPDVAKSGHVIMLLSFMQICACM